MTYRLLIFDFDGTLADSLPWFLTAIDECARHFDFRRPDRAQVEALRSVDGRAIMRFLGVPMWKLPAIARHMRRRAVEAPPPALFAGVEAALHLLADSGAILAIASSNSEVQIRRALGPGLAGRIAHYACEASPFGKAAHFRRLLRASGVPSAAGLAIGDELRDITAARQAGLAAGAVTWGYATVEALRRAAPDTVFDTPADLTRLVMPRPG